MSSWRMAAKCESCPFARSGPGLRQRRALAPGRWAEILAGLRANLHFWCHKTVADLEEGEPVGAGAKVCAGSLEWSEAHGVSQNYVRVCERLEWAQRERERRAAEAGR